MLTASSVSDAPNHHSDYIYAPRVIIMLLENIYDTGITYDCHLQLSKHFDSTSHWCHRQEIKQNAN